MVLDLKGALTVLAADGSKIFIKHAQNIGSYSAPVTTSG